MATESDDEEDEDEEDESSAQAKTGLTAASKLAAYRCVQSTRVMPWQSVRFCFRHVVRAAVCPMFELGFSVFSSRSSVLASCREAWSGRARADVDLYTVAKKEDTYGLG